MDGLRVGQERVLKNTSSGGGGINETVNHVICKELPFGGGEKKISQTSFISFYFVLFRTRLI